MIRCVMRSDYTHQEGGHHTVNGVSVAPVVVAAVRLAQEQVSPPPLCPPVQNIAALLAFAAR